MFVMFEFNIKSNPKKITKRDIKKIEYVKFGMILLRTRTRKQNVHKELFEQKFTTLKIKKRKSIFGLAIYIN